MLHLAGKIQHALTAHARKGIAAQGGEGEHDAQDGFNGLVQRDDDGRRAHDHAGDAEADADERRRHADAHFHILTATGLAQRKKRVADAVKAKPGGDAQHDKTQLRAVVLPAGDKPGDGQSQHQHRELEPGYFAQQGAGAAFASRKGGQQKIIEAHVGNGFYQIAEG